MKHLIRLSMMAMLILVLAAPVATPVAAQEGVAVVRPETATLDIGQGQVETLNFVLENAQEVYGIDVRASFDPAIVEVVDADLAREGIQIIPGLFPQPDFLVRNIADNEAGTLRYVTTQVSPTLPINGTGIVFSVQFRGKALSQQSSLTIEAVEIADRRGIKLSVQSKDGVLNIVPPKPPTPTALVSATPTLTPTPSLTLEAVVGIAPTAAEAASMVAPANTPSTPSFSRLLLGIAVGGGLGAVVLLGMAFAMLRRPPRRRVQKRKNS